MKIKNIILNILASIFVITLFLFAFTWIIFDFQGSSNSLKDTWSIVSSLFGGIATLAAAYIASLLFNDWRIQHNKQILAIEAKETFRLFHNQRDYINSLIHQCGEIMSSADPKKLSWNSVANDYENIFLNQVNQDKDQMSAFCFLSEGQLAHDLTTKYLNNIESLTKYLGDKRALPHSNFIFLNKNSCGEFINQLNLIYNDNCNVLKELKSYILVLPSK